jgi:RNA polymerase sigma factor (sigma-70 family)
MAIDRRRHLERRRFYFNIQVDDLDPSRFVQESSLSSGLSSEEGSRLIEQVLQHLDAKQRATVEAYFFRGLSLNEIAQELNDSFGNVRHYFYRGLEKMRKVLGAAVQPDPSRESIRTNIAKLQPDRLAKGFGKEVSVVRPRTI